MIDQEKIFDAALLIKNSNYVVVFSGAGISTEELMISAVLEVFGSGMIQEFMLVISIFYRILLCSGQCIKKSKI